MASPASVVPELAAPALAAESLAPPERRLTSGDINALVLATGLHLAIGATFFSSPDRLGIGGRDLEAIGVELVVLSTAVQSRTTARGREEAASGRAVAENDGGDNDQAAQASALDSQGQAPAASAMPSPESAPVEPEADSAAVPMTEPIERAFPNEASLRPSPSLEEVSDRARVALNQRSASEVLASFRGGAAARGHEDTADVRIAFASARAGLRNEFQLEVFKAIIARPPRLVRGVKGEVLVEFTVLRSGAIGEVRAIRSSGHASLDESAMAAVRAARVRPPPSAIPDEMLVFSMPFTFQ